MVQIDLGTAKITRHEQVTPSIVIHVGKPGGKNPRVAGRRCAERIGFEALVSNIVVNPEIFIGPASPLPDDKIEEAIAIEVAPTRTRGHIRRTRQHRGIHREKSRAVIDQEKMGTKLRGDADVDITIIVEIGGGRAHSVHHQSRAAH